MPTSSPRHRIFSFRFATLTCLATLLCSDLPTGWAQNAPPAANAVERRVTLTQSVEPSFHIEPIVHRFQARRGTVIPFQFEIKSTGKAMNVTVAAVQLRQEVTGIILHDLQGEAPSEMRFTSPTEFRLEPGQARQITGTVTVPLAKSNFLSFGVLVRDNGVSQSSDESTSNQTTAGVRFVTQYVLRVDIETGVKDLSQMNHLAFQSGQILEEKGMPVAMAYLVNPTDFAFECRIRGTIQSAITSRPRPFALTLPSRVNMEGDERYLIRIMPRSKILLTAPVDSMLFPGEQSLTLEVTNGRRALVEESFAVRSQPGDFPALETQLAYLDDSLSVQPAQIELGNSAGAKRTCTLRFTNNSMEPKTVQVAPRDLSGNSIEGLRLSSQAFEIKPGRTKSIRLSVKSSELNANGADGAIFGELEMRIASESQSQIIQSLPIALTFDQSSKPNVEIGQLERVVRQGHTSFVLSVTNQGKGFVPIHADLSISDQFGHMIELADGYGKWIRPGQTRELRFQPRHTLPAGSYQLGLSVKTTEDSEPLTRTLNIQLDEE